MTRLLAAALLALALPGTALAHATLTHTTPSFRERLERPPAMVDLHFDQRVKALPTSIEVRDAAGKLVSGVSTNAIDAREVETVLRHLRTGAYTVRWHAVSGDGHVVSGVFTFGVRAPAPPPTAAFGAGGPTVSDHVARWAYFLALAVLLGGLSFRLLIVRGPMPPAFERRFYLLTGIGALATIDAGILAFLLRAEDALQLPFGRLLYGDLSSMANGTRFGTAFIAMTLGFALVAALVFLAWLSDRPLLLWAPFLLGLGFASGLSLSGHSALASGSSPLSELADWVHLVAASLWIGGLLQLVVCLWPTVPELRRDAFLRFSRLATVLVALLVSAGVYLSVLRLPELEDLWQESYGHVLLVKLGLVTVALSWGALHHFVARPALERGAAGGRLLPRLPRSLLGESAVGMAILLAAAVLVNSEPPKPAPEPAQAAVVRAP
jgi:copper transport protein